MNHSKFIRLGGLILSVLLISSPLMSHAEGETESALAVVTNVLQFFRLNDHAQTVNCTIHFDGVIAWANDRSDQIIFQDATGAVLAEIPRPSEPLRAGQKMTLDGMCSGIGVGNDRQITSFILINDNKLHLSQEKSAAAFLDAGQRLIRLAWFTRDEMPELQLRYEGPDLVRQTIPATALIHAAERSGQPAWLPGLTYQSFEGDWWQLPDFHFLTPTRTGTVTNFNLSFKTRDTNVAINFSGALEISRAGNYKFSLVSSGAAQLCVQLLQLKVLGDGAPPSPRLFTIGQLLPDQSPSQWATLEGTVTFVGQTPPAGTRLTLSSATGNVNVQLPIHSQISPALLQNSRVRVTGICRGARALDGQMLPGVIFVPDSQQLELLEVPNELWTIHPLVPIRELSVTNAAIAAVQLLHVQGRVRSTTDGAMMIEDESGELKVETPQPLPATDNGIIEALGEPVLVGSNTILQHAFYRNVEISSSSPADLPLLTTMEQIKRLKRDDALHGFPVHVRGVITWSGGSAVVIQDNTGGIFVSEVPVADADGNRAGENWDIEGITSAQFSPLILARKVVRLGLGTLTEPLRPTWDQLINGSLDTQYVEVRGIITGLHTNVATLMTHGGKIQLDLPEIRAEDLRPYQDALVRVRGCLWAVKDNATHVFKIGEVQIFNASIDVEQAAPADPFAAPLKHAPDLLLFDAQAGAFQRVKVSGQLVYLRAGECFLMDAGTGVRCVPKNPVHLGAGDLVEAVGFPELDGPSPVLREAVMRRIGHAALPPAVRLSEETFLSGQHDSTLVKIDARLVKVSLDQKEQVLSLQLKERNFLARIDNQAEFVKSLRVGSQLELTGVYAARGGDRVAGREVDSFELLINQPSDVIVIAQPSWWTLRRLLTIVGVLAAVLGIASVWISLLHRQVDERTRQLKDEILVRERTEHQRAVEAERSRIARDLHDDLGSSLTEISLLADAGPGSPPSLERAGQRFQTIGDKARAVVNALDVIVWLVNPRKDVLPFLAGYLASYTEEYLTACGIACRLKIPLEIPSVHLTAEVRHSLFLAVKESLRNIVRHAHASEVVMELTADAGQLRISIADNGQGFDSGNHIDGNGLVNLRERLVNIGGRCEIESRPETGTRISLLLPLQSNHSQTI